MRKRSEASVAPPTRYSKDELLRFGVDVHAESAERQLKIARDEYDSLSRLLPFRGHNGKIELQQKMNEALHEIQRCERLLGKSGRSSGTLRQRARSVRVKAYKDRRIAAGLRGCECCAWIVPSGMPISMIEIHHVVPVAKGGSDEDSNLIAVCPNCHEISDRLAQSENPPLDRDHLLGLLMRPA